MWNLADVAVAGGLKHRRQPLDISPKPCGNLAGILPAGDGQGDTKPLAPPLPDITRRHQFPTQENATNLIPYSALVFGAGACGVLLSRLGRMLAVLRARAGQRVPVRSRLGAGARSAPRSRGAGRRPAKAPSGAPLSQRKSALRNPSRTPKAPTRTTRGRQSREKYSITEKLLGTNHR